MDEVDMSALPSEADAIKKILELEAKTPGLVPAGFRERVQKSPKDAALRLAMAKCELENPLTLRRAAQDAGLAALLGADPSAAYEVARSAFFPDGVESRSCSSHGECTWLGAGARCEQDGLGKTCRSPAYRTSRTVSAAELEVDELLGGAFLKRLDEKRYIDSLWAFGARQRCGKTLCRFSRYQVLDKVTHGIKQAIVYWDVKYHGAMGSTTSKLSEDEKRCRASTGGGMQGVDRESCYRWCGQGRQSEEAACNARCAANCSK